jgi:hypothetical protein
VASKVFAHHMLEKIINCFNYHIDLHTASFGRVNSYYVRADMNNEHTAMMAKLQKPQIILHNSGQDGNIFQVILKLPDLIDTIIRYSSRNSYAALNQLDYSRDWKSAAVSKPIRNVVLHRRDEYFASSQDDSTKDIFRQQLSRGSVKSS